MDNTIHINDQEYQLKDLPREVIENLEIIQITKEKLEELKATLTFFKKAREAYKAEILSELEKSEESFNFGLD